MSGQQLDFCLHHLAMSTLIMDRGWEDEMARKRTDDDPPVHVRSKKQLLQG